MTKPLKYTKVKVIKITVVQHKTLKNLEGLNIKVSDFIRDAISEKLEREAKEIIEKSKNKYCPF